MANEEPPTRPDETAGAADRRVQPSHERAATPPAAEPQARIPARPPRTRTSTAFIGLVAGAIVLVLLLVFILENTQSVKVSYFGASGDLALGVALLLAAVGGALLVGLLGVARMAQMRRHARRRARSRPGGRPHGASDRTEPGGS